MKESKKIIMVSAAAKLLDVSISGVKYLVKKGELSCVTTMEGFQLFNHEDVLKLVTKREEARQLAA